MTDRRRLLQSAALLGFGLPALAGCPREDGGDGQTPRAPSPEEAAELELIAAYDAALAGAPEGRRAAYARIREEHVQHLRALGGSPVATVPPSATASAAAPNRRSLIRAERRAMRSATNGAVVAEDPDRAQLLALIAASEAQHAAALEVL